MSKQRIAAYQIAAYQNVQRWRPSRREAEAMAFTKAARLLAEARKNPGDYGAYAAVLRFNQRLWTLIQADLVEKENKLPNHLKANLLSLSIFVDRQTLVALTEPKAEHLDSLCNINRNIAQGLLAAAGGASGRIAA